MARYMSLFTLTGEALSRLVANPQDREAAVRAMIEGLGGTLETYYVMFGQYDGFVVFEAPDSTTAASGAVLAGASGAFSHIETNEVLTPNQFMEVLQKAKGGSFRAPGT